MVDGRAGMRGWSTPVRLLLDSVGDGVLMADSRGRRVYANPALNQLVGSDARLPLSSHLPPRFLPHDQHDLYHRQLDQLRVASGRAGTAVTSPWEILDRAGQRTRVAVTAVAVDEADAGLGALWWVLRSTEHGVDRRSARIEQSLLSIAAEITDLTSVIYSDRFAVEPGLHLELLSGREREVCLMLLDGHRVGAIAVRLGLAESTVRNHLKAVFRKTGVRSQVELIELARGGFLASRPNRATLGSAARMRA